MLHILFTSLIKLIQQELNTCPTAAQAQIPETLPRTVLKNTPNSTPAAQVAGIDVSTNELHMDNGAIYQITTYKDPYGKVCEPEDACAVEASNGNGKIRVEFYSTRYTLH